MDECARLGERGGWNTLEVRGEGEERRLKPGWMEDGGRVGRDTSNRSLLLRIGLSTLNGILQSKLGEKPKKYVF